MTASATIFDRPVNVSRMEDIRDTVVRPAMHALPFPMWCLKHLRDGLSFKNSTENVHQLIDLYTAFANSGSTDGRSDNDIATDIGRLIVRHPGLAEDLHSIMSEQKVREGMKNYLDDFEDGILPKLGEQIGDGGQYITRLQKRFSADAANWVWFKETADQQIRMLILEYRIVVASNAVILHSNSFPEAASRNGAMSARISKSLTCTLRATGMISVPSWRFCMESKKTGELQENRREQFLQLIANKGAAFKTFYNHQESVFANACSYILQGIDADSVSEIYKQLPGSDLFTSEKSYYQQRVQETVKTWSESQEGAKLLKAWKDDKDGIAPRLVTGLFDASSCMVDDPSEEIKAKEAFDTINVVAKKKKVDGRALRMQCTSYSLMRFCCKN